MSYSRIGVYTFQPYTYIQTINAGLGTLMYNTVSCIPMSFKCPYAWESLESWDINFILYSDFRPDKNKTIKL